MQAIGAVAKSRRLSRVLKTQSPFIFTSFEFGNSVRADSEISYFIPLSRRFCSAIFLGIIHGNSCQMHLNCLENKKLPMPLSARQSFLFSTEAGVTENDFAEEETVKRIYDKMLKCVSDKRTSPPNAWLWSLVAKCSSPEDIELLFNILQRLRIFRLSNLRIPDSFNSALCREVTKACVRVGAIEFGKKTLWKHNLYGLSPDIGSVNHLLLHAKEHKDVKLMVEVMKLVKKNVIPLQPGTADIVLSICSRSDRPDLISKYGKRFLSSGVRLRQTSFDLWMEFVVNRGDTESLWKIEKRRSETIKQHSVSSGFSCAKGFLLAREPENAASVIQETSQSISDKKKPDILVELRRLVTEWAPAVIKRNEENRKAFAAALQNDIHTMINALPSFGVDANIQTEYLS